MDHDSEVVRPPFLSVREEILLPEHAEIREAVLRDSAVDVFALLESEEPAFDWLIPGVLERGDRMIVTGREGAGKSTLLAQLAVQVAAGLHPFDGSPMEPIRVLVVDLENSRREVKRRFNALTLTAGPRLERGSLFIASRPEGLNLLDAEDADWLARQLDLIGPDLLIAGPLYKLADGDPNDEKSVKPVALYLDRLRTEFDLAVVLEAHIPHDAKGRPYGWSGWRRWPEIGIELTDVGLLKPWRHARHETPGIPAALKRGGEWPFSPADRTRDILWAQICDFVAEVRYRPSEREVAMRLRASQPTVHRAIAEHSKEWAELEGTGR